MSKYEGKANLAENWAPVFQSCHCWTRGSKTSQLQIQYSIEVSIRTAATSAPLWMRKWAIFEWIFPLYLQEHQQISFSLCHWKIICEWDRTALLLRVSIAYNCWRNPCRKPLPLYMVEYGLCNKKKLLRTMTLLPYIFSISFALQLYM